MKKAYNIIALCLTGLQRAVRAALACVGINCFKAAEHSCDSRKENIPWVITKERDYIFYSININHFV